MSDQPSRDERAPTRWNFSRLQNDLVKRCMWLGEGREAEAAQMHGAGTLRQALLDDVTKAAMEYAISIGADLDTYEDELAAQGIEIIDWLEGAFLDHRGRDWSAISGEERWNFWRHDNDPKRTVLGGKLPSVDRTSLEAAASEYLKLRYRSPLLERTLVDTLIGVTVLYVLNKSIGLAAASMRDLAVGKDAGLNLRNTHPGRRYVSALIAAVCVTGLLVAMNWYLVPSLMSEQVAGIVTWVIAGLIAFGFVVNTIELPFVWSSHSKRTARVGKLIDAHLVTYAALDTSNVHIAVSTAYLRELAKKAADIGAEWPPPLFALLDDNLRRTGTL